MCKAAEVMEFTKLCLAMDQIETPDKRLEWIKEEEDVDLSDILQVKIPMHGRVRSTKASLEIDVQRKLSLESAGRRIALFTRLTEENGLDSFLDSDATPFTPESVSPQLRIPFKDYHRPPFKIAAQ